MKNTIENQNRWLNGLEEGTRIMAKGGIWIRPKWTNNEMLLRHGESIFVNVETGELKHFSRLSDLEKPPRIECYASIFEAILSAEEIEAEVKRLRDRGWTQQDFANALEKLLDGSENKE